MKNESAKGVLQLIFSIIIYYVVDVYFFYFLNKVGINFDGDAYLIANAFKYVLICLIVYLIYRDIIHASKSRFGKTWILSVIFSVGSCVLLVFANFLLHKLIGIFHDMNGYGLVNYFQNSLTLNTALDLIVNVILKPFLLVIIFPLGVSNIIKNMNTASLASGALFGITNMLLLGNDIETAFFITIVPAVIMMLLTYLYKANHNIWMIYVSYVLYIGFGFYVLRYFA